MNDVGCVRFEELDLVDERAIGDMSVLASAIVKEHFDPIIGPAQNDYMIERFQSSEAVARMLQQGYRYYFVLGCDGRRIGFLAFVPRGAELYLSKFYLQKQFRGRGYAHAMMAFVSDAARAAGCRSVTLNVNRQNDARFAYEKMGFEVVRAEVNDIGNGFVMDDYVYELKL